jgi:glycosyltransferase involved in cell wall biosynthesis
MIVKNEAAILERCLASIAPYADAWVIGDTGSADGTPELIESFFASRGIPGELHRFPFRDFGQARNRALDLARASPLAFDYLLFADADMEFVVDRSDFRDRLSADAYSLRQQNEIAYCNTRLVRRDVPSRYVGATHEHLELPAPAVPLDEAWFIDHACGSNRADKFERDIRLLQGSLAQDPDNPRGVFYLAQSERDAGRLADARATYRRRISMAGWPEEVWYSLYQVARLSEALGDDPATVDDAYLAAYCHRPLRAEPLVDLARRNRERREWAMALLYARAAAATRRPADQLFLDVATYAWRALDEVAISAWYAGAHADGMAASQRLLEERRYPPTEHARIVQNRAFYGPVPE